MEELLKATNLFLSVFGLCLDIDQKDPNNSNRISIVDSNGDFAGVFTKVSNSESTIEVEKLGYGALEANVKPNNIDYIHGDKNSKYKFYSIGYSFIPKESITTTNFDALYGYMQISKVNATGPVEFQIHNNMSLHRGNEEILKLVNNYNDKFYDIRFRDASLVLSESNHGAVMEYKGIDGCELSVENSDYKEYGDVSAYLMVDYHSHNDVGNISIETSTPTDGVMDDIKTVCETAALVDESFYSVIEKARRILTIENAFVFDEVSIFDNVASLCSHAWHYTDEELQLIYGYIPQQLKSTPIIGDNGMVILPKDKQRAIHIGTPNPNPNKEE